MIELELEINRQKFLLNEFVDVDKLKSSEFKKLSFFARLLLKPRREETIYFSKNCNISMFKSFNNQSDAEIYGFEGHILGEFIFVPSRKNQKYLSGTWRTSAYIYYDINRLSKISFQTIGNRIMSKMVINEFEKRIKVLYGNPDCEEQKGIRICTWSDENSRAVSELNENINNSYIHWLSY